MEYPLQGLQVILAENETVDARGSMVARPAGKETICETPGDISREASTARGNTTVEHIALMKMDAGWMWHYGRIGSYMKCHVLIYQAFDSA